MQWEFMWLQLKPDLIRMFTKISLMLKISFLYWNQLQLWIKFERRPYYTINGFCHHKRLYICACNCYSKHCTEIVWWEYTLWLPIVIFLLLEQYLWPIAFLHWYRLERMVEEVKYFWLYLQLQNFGIICLHSVTIMHL